jgi:hypothetical protein
MHKFCVKFKRENVIAAIFEEYRDLTDSEFRKEIIIKQKGIETMPSCYIIENFAFKAFSFTN